MLASPLLFQFSSRNPFLHNDISHRSSLLISMPAHRRGFFPNSSDAGKFSPTRGGYDPVPQRANASEKYCRVLYRAYPLTVYANQPGMDRRVMLLLFTFFSILLPFEYKANAMDVAESPKSYATNVSAVLWEKLFYIKMLGKGGYKSVYKVHSLLTRTQTLLYS